MRTILFFLVLTSAEQAAAQAYLCHEPVLPACVTNFRTFEDQRSFDWCKRDMETYQLDVGQYLRCLSDAGDAALDEMRRGIDYWNCKARGDRLCYLR